MLFDVESVNRPQPQRSYYLLGLRTKQISPNCKFTDLTGCSLHDTFQKRVGLKWCWNLDGQWTWWRQKVKRLVSWHQAQNYRKSICWPTSWVIMSLPPLMVHRKKFWMQQIDLWCKLHVNKRCCCKTRNRNSLKVTKSLTYKWQV